MKVQTTNFDKSGMYKCTYKTMLWVSEHIHQCTEIIYVINGNLSLTVGNERRVIGAGDIALIPPFVPHKFDRSPDLLLWLCVFSNDLLFDFLPREYLYKRRSSACFHISDRLASFLSGALPDSKEEMVPFNYTERRKIMSILFPIINEYMENTEESNDTNSNHSLLSNVLLYLDRHYSDALTIKDVAKALGYTPRHISRQISTLKEYNFRSLLNCFRIEHAKLMMRKSDAKLIDIAMNCGFTSERTFFRAFIDSEKITPNEYRKLLRQ